MNTVQMYAGRGNIAPTTEPTDGSNPLTAPTAAQPLLRPDNRQLSHRPLIAPQPNERWLPFPGYARRYQVSDRGRVRTSDGQPVPPGLHPDGYLCVWLTHARSTKPRACSLPIAVAEAFLPNPDRLPFVKHIDGDPANCTASNLVWKPLGSALLPFSNSSTSPIL